MSATTPCTPCCATTQTVNIPGVEGDDGTNGTDGLNAFTTVTAPGFVVPALNATVTVSVASSLFAVIGQILIVGQGAGAALAGPGPATFEVDSIPGVSSLSLKYLGYSGDVVTGSTISAGAIVSPSGGLFASPLPIALGGTGAATVAAALTALGLGYTPLSVYGVGAIGTTAYVMTAAAVNDPTTEVNINGTAIELTLSHAGTYLIQGRARIDYNGATFAANKTITAKLRRSNNTAADVTAASSSLVVPVITTLTYTHTSIEIPPVIYTTANATDVLQMLSRIVTLPGAGTVEIAEASIVAVKLY